MTDQLITSKIKSFNYTQRVSYNSNYNYYVTIYNHLDGGFRVNSPNSFLYDIIIDIGKFIEVHKEGTVTFLVYEVESERFLINRSKDSRNGASYIIDFWCISDLQDEFEGKEFTFYYDKVAVNQGSFINKKNTFIFGYQNKRDVIKWESDGYEFYFHIADSEQRKTEAGYEFIAFYLTNSTTGEKAIIKKYRDVKYGLELFDFKNKFYFRNTKDE